MWPELLLCAGRALPPSGILNRVLIAVQNPGALTKGTLQIVDAYYDIRHSYNNKVASFSIGGIFGSGPHDHPEYAGRAGRRGLRRGRRQLRPDQLRQRKANHHRELAGSVLQRLYLPRPAVRFCRQPGGAHAHRAGPDSRHQLWVESAQRLPCLHQPKWFGCLGFRAGQQPGLQRLQIAGESAGRPPMR